MPTPLRYLRAQVACRALRRNVALSLCLLLLLTATGPTSAQKRAIRVPAGAEARLPALPRKSERERERQSAARSRTKARAQDGPIVRGADQVGEVAGVPSVGEAGVERSTAQLMDAQANAPVGARGGRPLLVPEHEIPGRKSRPQNPKSKPVASFPFNSAAAGPGARALSKAGVKTAAADDAPSPLAPQTVGLDFATVTGPTETGAFPPDTMGAIGPAQFFVFLNGRLRTFNKTTGAADGVVNVDSDVFFASVMTPAPAPLNINFSTDPQVRYDRLSGRWILVMIDVPSANDIGDTPNRIMIAVSDAASAGVISAGTVWTFYFIQQNTVGGANSGGFCDYESLGVDANALYVGCDEFDAAAGGFNNTTAFVIRKSSVLSGGPVVVTAFRDLIGTDGPFEPRGVDNFDPAATEGYFIGASAAAFGRLIMRRIGTPGATPTISANISITVASTSFPRSVDHLGDSGGTGATGNLDALDDRLMAAHIRNGRLWTSHSISVTSAGVSSGTNAERRNAVRWYELIVPPTTGTPTVNQSGTIFDTAATRAAAREYWIPSVMVSGQGHAALGYSTAGTPFRADAATNGRLVGDTLGTTGAVNIYTASSTAYNPPGDPGSPRRWGDYSFTSLDPFDDMTMWTIQQYCNGTGTYNARVAKLLAPVPATPSAAVPAAVPAGDASEDIVITGTSVAGSGFYDPGANLAPPALPFNHITATVPGVIVNSVTYNSPTQVTLNISTVGATQGAKTVTITNPDGQSMSGAATITVTPPPAPAATAGQVVVSEFRFRGAGGASDEFVELYNKTNGALDISGYTLHALTAAGAQNLRFTVPGALASSTTVIPARGHYLITGSAYSLAAAAASNGALSTGIVDGSSIGLFAGATPTAGTRIDSAGFDARDPLFFEGTALTPTNTASSGATGNGGITVDGQYSFMRKLELGTPQDTGNNESDFVFVSTTGGTFSTRVSRLGAPGPENLTSPINRTAIKASLVDINASSSAAPNRVRVQRASCAGCDNTKSDLGTLEIRRKFTNNTGASVTRLRFRIVDITTLGNRLPAQADLRVLNATGNFSVTLTAGAGNATVQSLTLEAPSDAVTMGGGYNSTLAAGTITSGTPIASGAAINVNFLTGVQLSGDFRFFVIVEALP